MSIAKISLDFWEDFLSLIFPRTCKGCGNSLYNFEEVLCGICESKLPIISEENESLRSRMLRKFYGLVRIAEVAVFLKFTRKGTVQRLMHQLKYKNSPEIGHDLGRRFGKEMLKNGAFADYDLIVPVPLHPKKQYKRGYNQSEAIAKGMSEVMNLSLSKDALLRRKFTESQTRKSRFDRYQNMNDVFHVKSAEIFAGKKVLLVDDILTTGATLTACAQQLEKVGTSEISIAVLAAGGRI
ncbi:ComF family protein [Penaeicola halotolerans]|uniref:ComF family protein n=1 Tax=Penaeicola halotolerans TaxID=2793196 RepID=UPI001CF868C1|nr:phosphoribosyltransferase family protein [Penaeicola halotolerans]